MPITIQPATLKVKNGSTYYSADSLKGDPGDVTIVAEDYSDLTFPVAAGKLCTHDNVLYKANQAISTSEAWTAAHWTATTIEDEFCGKADKVDSATSGNLPILDSNGNLIDSGYKPSSFVTDVSGKADKSDTVLSTTLSRGRKSETTVGSQSMAFGDNVEASGTDSVAFGRNTIAKGQMQHVFGRYNVADDPSEYSAYWAANTEYVAGAKVKNRGAQDLMHYYICIEAHTSGSTFDSSKWYDVPNYQGTQYLEIVGNGESNAARSNARSLDWGGNEKLQGDLTVFAGTNDETSVSQLRNEINVLEPSASAGDVGKFLKAKTVADGKVTEYEFGEGGGSSVTVDNTLSTTSENPVQNKIITNALNETATLSGLTIKGNIQFTFGTNGTGSLSESNGNYIITGQESSTNAVSIYVETTGFNTYKITPYQYAHQNVLNPTLNSFLFPFYKNGDNCYCFRFKSVSEIAIQRYNISSYSGAQVQVSSINHGWSSGKEITVTNDGKIVSLYISGKRLYQYDYTGLKASSGFNVGGYICTTFNKAVSTSSETIFNNFSVYNDTFDHYALSEDSKEAIELGRIANSHINRGYHFSFDDTTLVFQDLTTNANTYTSIFDNSFLSDLKGIHDVYGACFSLYCFYQNDASSPTFNLENATDKFANEFKENADWLRFGFHSYAPSTSYESGSASESLIATHYNAVITQLIRITGSINCIDRIPRLHNYAGSLTACKAIRDTQCGVVGLIASAAYSDSQERDSYYFDTDQNAYMACHYKYFDPDTNMVFLKTAYGINSITTANNYVTTQAKANMRDFVEVFLHENQWTSGNKTMFTNIAETFTLNGYSSSFYMDRII